MNRYRLPAEWEAQSGIQLTWPHKLTDWESMLEEITDTYMEMAREITKHEKLLVVAPVLSDLPEELLQLENTQFFECPTNDTWARDHAFLTLLATESSSPLLLDFQFNGWGEKFDAELDNAINKQLHEQGIVRGTYESHLDFVLEGGSIESDGKGTIFTTSQCLMAPHRNQPLTQDQIEEQLKQRLKAERVVWLNHGQLIGDDTDGHIDTIVRTAPHDTLLYIGCDTPEDEQYEDFLALEQQLQALRKADGTPYRLLRLPMPDAIIENGERLPATYANFLVINDAVLVPTYAQPEKDLEAMQIISEAFPNRKIVGIDARAIITQHGSIHCCAMQYPTGVLSSSFPQ